MDVVGGGGDGYGCCYCVGSCLLPAVVDLEDWENALLLYWGMSLEISVVELAATSLGERAELSMQVIEIGLMLQMANY